MLKQEYEALKRVGKRVMIHAYKFNGWLYRSWEYPMIISNEDDYVVLANHDTKILTSEYKTKRVFSSETKHPSFWVFFKKEWFNLLVSIIDNRPQYYINVSSKFIYEESAIKYIDFDLDFKILPNNNWFELDANEYKESIELFNYPKALIAKISEIERQIKKLIDDDYFSKKFNIDILKEYTDIYNKQLKVEKTKSLSDTTEL